MKIFKHILTRSSTFLIFLSIPTLGWADLLDDEDAPKSIPSQSASDTDVEPSLKSPPELVPSVKPKTPATPKATKSSSRATPKPSSKPVWGESPNTEAQQTKGESSQPTLPPTGKKVGPASPASNDSKQPVHFESKGLRALKEKGTAELIENVVVTQGTLQMEAEKAKIFYDDNIKDVVRVIAEGNVKIFKIDEESGEKIKAFGDRVEFDNKARTVVLDGNARLWRGADLIRGKKITYELDTGWVKADRVAGEVHPSEDKK